MSAPEESAPEYLIMHKYNPDGAHLCEATDSIGQALVVLDALGPDDHVLLVRQCTPWQEVESATLRP